MVTDKKIFNAAWMRYRLGNVLIALGVLTWLPFIVLRIAGEKPTLLLYLPFHLLGVIGGARLRAYARKELDITPAKQSILKLIGHGMIILGILVWTPYLYLRSVNHFVEAMDYLPYHLLGIFSGVTCLAVDMWLSKKTS